MKRRPTSTPKPVPKHPAMPEYLARVITGKTVQEKLDLLAVMERNVRQLREHVLLAGQGDAALN